MVKFGYTLSSEEQPPERLVELAVDAESRGFDFASISDHYHPWISEQGHAGFVWTVLGAIAARTTTLEVGVGVTCPILRIHPAVIAQATATTSRLFGGRFVFGVGTGEALNEHIFGDRWPPADVRLDMLEEAVGLIRRLWSGESVTHRGAHYTVEDARIFDRPDGDLPILISAFGEQSAQLAARCGDGLWTTGASSDVVKTFEAGGGSGPRWSQVSLCWATDRDKAIETVHRVWPTTAVPGQLSQDLRTVAHFETAVSIVTPEMVAEAMPCGPDPAPVIEKAREAIDAGIDHVYFHQIGDDQEGFFRFWQEELAPALK